MRNIIKSALLSLAFTSLTIGVAAQGMTQSPAATPFAQTTTTDERYRIGLQDSVTITVDRHADLTQTVPVRPNGTIELFRLEKPLVALCKTEEELAEDVRKAYMETYLRNPQVRVRADQKSQPIFLIGAVEKPGQYLVSRKYHLLEILASAGGPNKDAGTRLVVVRGGNTSACRDANAAGDPDVSVIAFKLRDITDGKTIFWMQPGDTVTIASADNIYVYGNVNKQGVFAIREQITLRQAIVLAEGTKPAAKKDKIRLLRQKPGTTEHEEMIFDLNAIDKGKVKDPILEPNDIVAVSEDRTKAILHGIGNAIKTSVPSAIYRIP